MKIAIVDDMESEQNCIKEIILRYGSKNGLAITCDLYENGESFLAAAKVLRYDLVFLDIYMEKTSGIQTAERLRQMDLHCILVFLTSSSEHRAEAFAVHAFDYLEKPLDENNLFRVLKDALNLLTKKRPYIDLTIGKQTVSVFYSDIFSVTSDSNYLVIRTDKTLRCRMSFRSLSSILQQDGRFLVINRGVLVNLDQVTSMENLTCKLNDGSSFPINRKKEAALKQAYLTRQFTHRTKRVSKGGGIL